MVSTGGGAKGKKKGKVEKSPSKDEVVREADVDSRHQWTPMTRTLQSLVSQPTRATREKKLQG